ncbi:MAG: efflux RND transporter periplasmic adaptor subunit [Mucinivorans sp.]
MNTSTKLLLTASLSLLAACGSTPSTTTTAADSTALVDTDSESGATTTDSTAAAGYNPQQPSVDAVSSATAIANVATMNGVMTIPPQNYATVSLTMAGTVRSVEVMAGSYVKKGTVMATIENPEFITLQQSFLESSAQREFLEKEYLRQQTLAKDEVASQKKLQQSKADYVSMKSRHDAAAAQLKLLGVSTSSLLTNGIEPLLEVRAPLSGYVSKVQLNLGKHIAAGEPLCEMVDKSKILLSITAYEKDLNKIKVGDMVLFRVNSLDKNTYQAVVVAIGQQVDLKTRSVEVLAQVNQANAQFRPGMYITAKVSKK